MSRIDYIGLYLGLLIPAAFAVGYFLNPSGWELFIFVILSTINIVTLVYIHFEITQSKKAGVWFFHAGAACMLAFNLCKDLFISENYLFIELVNSALGFFSFGNLCFFLGIKASVAARNENSA